LMKSVPRRGSVRLTHHQQRIHFKLESPNFLKWKLINGK
jgi:hypothetical protein